jgi:hypothetical protein
MCKKFKIRKLTPDEKTNLSILASLIVMGGALLLILYCLMQALEVRYVV